MVYAGGLKYILLSAVIYGPGTVLFIIAKRKQKRSIFAPIEKCLFAVAIIAALAAVYSLAIGIITV